ncbi:MAG: tail fiber domain-containing protein [Anderseniella sp.]|jgi:hypothetical protein|nr:tail fiber domain-containing protein [Anderseniella sp.]
MVINVADLLLQDVQVPMPVSGRRAWAKPCLCVRLICEITRGGVGSICDNANQVGDRNSSCQNSDIRLKRDIKSLGSTPDGLTLYSFRYRWGSESFLGVMAQEVLEVKPEAVTIDENGFYAVDYDALGLKLISLDRWQRTKHLQ